MHYIRFLKAPRRKQDSRGFQSLSAVITITTDLGDAFLCSDLALLVELEDTRSGKRLDGCQPKDYTWRGVDGFKGLSVEIPIGKSALRAGLEVKMQIRAKDQQHMAEDFDHVLGHRPNQSDDGGGIVSLRGIPNGNGIVERVFKYGGDQSVHIWEESGESIARHIWDAGLVLSAYLTTVLGELPSSRTLPKLPILQTLLSKSDLNVIELGAGCGIVGITLHQLLPNISHMILTDLPEATSILTHNISLSSPSPAHSVLDWSQPLPQSIASTQWNLVLIADCTYNPDVVPDLVQTLGRLADGNKDLIVLLAMKVRHASEAVFFTLMQDEGWMIRERTKLPLPVLSGEEEEIEIFVFGVLT
ncbi:hypothetical protein ONS95_011947 [Cadophora gregata]|uniref:uncharacterized protein n=1 Tax=Cadophora gregata TaxID=51156 RepID=UPI0026DC8CA4|nr:uncharacterized protein ONS95_011947 [Cadophora gregata]KAK0117612.1 hypothetical protein ONS95_011947 [Cadophora gregata]KAK0122663.1 hypothetical protein ONS96_009701 [Cadophora gregata f. sp. sojae]